MTEPEVSLRVAMKYVHSGEACKDIIVSIDGAHIKTLNTVHFDIVAFMRENGYLKCDDNQTRWQGEYQKLGFATRIIICSKSGIGDVTIAVNNGKTLYIESKKFKSGSGGEYPAMREAIGQLMTGCSDDENKIPIVAVPFNSKSFELSKKWSCNERIRNAGIRFMLVHTDGDIDVI